MKRIVALILIVLCTFAACAVDSSESTTIISDATETTCFVEDITELPLNSEIEVRNFVNKMNVLNVKIYKLFEELRNMDCVTEDILNRLAMLQEERNELKSSAEKLSRPAYLKLEKMAHSYAYWCGPIVVPEDVKVLDSVMEKRISVDNETIILHKNFWYNIEWADNISVPENAHDDSAERVYKVIDKTKTAYAIIERSSSETPLLLIIYPD